MRNLTKKSKKKSSGMSLTEIVIATAIFAMISVGIWGFGRDIFFFNSNLNASLSTQFDARQVLRKLVTELRSASPSSLGAYPIATAGTSTITFYSDIDDDGLKEQVRYFRQGNELRRGTIKPSGNPLVYSGSESVSIVVKDVINDNATPLFNYYDNSYAGTSSPLTIPVNVLAIRLVKINLIIDKDTTRPPAAITVMTQVTLRNLKDN